MEINNSLGLTAIEMAIPGTKRGVVITSLGHTVCRMSSTDLAHASLKLTSKADGQCLFSAGRWRLRDVM